MTKRAAIPFGSELIMNSGRLEFGTMNTIEKSPTESGGRPSFNALVMGGHWSAGAMKKKGDGWTEFCAVDGKFASKSEALKAAVSQYPGGEAWATFQVPSDLAEMLGWLHDAMTTVEKA